MRAMSLLVRFVVMGALLAACASADSKQSPRPTKEVSAGGARIRGGGVRMDVQIGRGLTKAPAKAGNAAVTPHAVVTP